MKLVLSDDRCQGHGRCYSLAPTLFDSDDYGNSQLVVPGGFVPAGEEAAAELAAANCPEHAIQVEA